MCDFTKYNNYLKQTYNYGQKLRMLAQASGNNPPAHKQKIAIFDLLLRENLGKGRETSEEFVRPKLTKEIIHIDGSYTIHSA